MVTSWLLASVVLFSQNPPADSAASRGKEWAADVRRLVQQLDDPARAQRDAAEKQLIEQGPEVLQLLPAITPRTSAETKERLGRVRRALETALSEANSQATTVTLSGQMTLAAALEAVTKQTGNQITGYDRRAVDVTTKFDKTAFWPALDQILDQSELQINAYGGELNTLVLQAKAEGMRTRFGNAVYSGVFRFEPIRVESRRDLRNPAVNGLRLTMEVAWEPRITPILIRQPIDKISAVDNQGNSISIRAEESQTVLNATAESGMSAVEIGIPLDLPARGTHQIASLKGTLTAMIPGRLESFEFTDLETARDVEQQRAGVSVILERMRRNGDLYEIRIRVRYEEASNALESHRGWVYSNPAYVLDKNGEKFESLGTNEGSRDVNEIGLILLYDLPDGPKNYKFVYRTPATMLQLPVEYELQDIELP